MIKTIFYFHGFASSSQSDKAKLFKKYISSKRNIEILVPDLNNNFEDVILSKYFTVDYILNYKIFDKYNLNISAKNMLDKRYSEAYEYKAPGRSINFVLNSSF